MSSNLKFAGVHLDKKRRGDVIEYAPEQKIGPAVMTALSNHDPDYAMWATDVKVDAFRFSPNGDPLKKTFQNNSYFAEGTAVIAKRRRNGDVQLEPKLKRFSIQFADKLSDIGLPDLDIKKFVIS